MLAGGGARGIGHVGVIRLLEELNIQVDGVAGTSMGSIVGGLYSAGYTSREMLAWLEQCDWDQLLSDGLPRPRRGFRVKAEEQENPRWIEFGLGATGLKVPNAYISGQNLLVAVRERTAFVGARRSFDELRVGMERGSIRYSNIRAPSSIVIRPDGRVETFDVAADLKNYSANRAYGSLTLDRLDDLFFPRHGYFLQGSLEREFGS